MTSPNYVRGQLARAVYALAVSAEPIQQRLEDAYVDALKELTADDFSDPEEHALFQRIMQAMTAKPAVAREGAVRASTSSMSDVEAVAVARRVLDLHHLVDPERGES